MYQLLFERSTGELMPLGNYETRDQVEESIRSFLAQFPNFHSYYWRVWSNSEGEEIVDVGSHTEFFHIRSV